MGYIWMPSFAFRASPSEDASVRSGFSLTEAEMLAHLPADHPLRADVEKDVGMRAASDVYADTVGDLLHALTHLPRAASVCRTLFSRPG